MAKMKLVKDAPLTQAQLVGVIAEEVGLAKKEVACVLDAYKEAINCHLKKGAVGKMKVLGMINLKVVKKAARKARKGINPFTGEEIMIKAKPASKSVKASALKSLKEIAN